MAAEVVPVEAHAVLEVVHAPAVVEPPAPSLGLPTFDLPDEPAAARTSVADSTIRVDVALLDSLMNLVGELVLTRNQMLQRVATREDVELARTTHRLNLVAGELQESVMKMRLQQIDTLWSKLPRVCVTCRSSWARRSSWTCAARRPSSTRPSSRPSATR